MNNIPVGNPEQDVHDQACERNPGYCSQETDQQREQTRVASLKGRILGWLSKWSREKNRDYVDDAEAKRRQDICVKCPKNKDFSDGCSSCRAAVKEYRKSILEHRPIRPGVNGCVITGEDLPVSLYLDQPAEDNKELPDGCWRKKTI